mgnify:CR=1 FL=1
MTWEQTAEVLAREVDRLQKENDRLRDEYQALYKRHDENLEAKYAIARVRHSYCRLRDGVQRNVELISEDIDKEWFPLLSKVQQNLLELLSPAAEGGGALDEAMSANRKMKTAAKALFASGRITRDELHSIIYHDDEGGGAAIGGESKPLVCHEMTAEETAEAAEIIRKAWEGVDAEQSAWEKSLHEASLRALKTVWWNAKHGKSANGGESQALQAAILGLHTLAGEFPTPTWKTREDYLQATISEINEILGKQ